MREVKRKSDIARVSRAVSDYEAAVAAEKAAKEAKDTARRAILKIVGYGGFARIDDGRIVYFAGGGRRRQVDSKRLKEELPKVYKAYSYVVSFSPFVKIKDKKEGEPVWPCR